MWGLHGRCSKIVCSKCSRNRKVGNFTNTTGKNKICKATFLTSPMKKYYYYYYYYTNNNNNMYKFRFVPVFLDNMSTCDSFFVGTKFCIGCFLFQKGKIHFQTMSSPKSLRNWNIARKPAWILGKTVPKGVEQGRNFTNNWNKKGSKTAIFYQQSFSESTQTLCRIVTTH